MKGYINNKNFIEGFTPMKYWSFPKNYKGDKNQVVRSLIMSGEYLGSIKKDGYYQRLVKDDEGNIALIARNPDVKGNPIDKHEWVPQLNEFFDMLPNGTCLVGELYFPNKAGSRNVTTVMGCLKDKAIARQEKGEKLHFYVFDVCAYNGLSLMDTSASQRFEYLKKIPQSTFTSCAVYFNGPQLLDELGQALARGEEGMVIMRQDAPIYEKRTPARVSIKIKKEITQTIDCVFTGGITPPTKEYKGKDIEKWQYWIDVNGARLEIKSHYKEYFDGMPYEAVTRPYYHGWAGSLELGVVKDNVVVPIGYLSGLTDEIKSNPKAYKGRCVEVSAMEINEGTNGLRHPVFVGFRDDLTIHDCTYEKVFGEK